MREHLASKLRLYADYVEEGKIGVKSYEDHVGAMEYGKPLEWKETGEAVCSGEIYGFFWKFKIGWEHG